MRNSLINFVRNFSLCSIEKCEKFLTLQHRKSVRINMIRNFSLCEFLNNFLNVRWFFNSSSETFCFYQFLFCLIFNKRSFWAWWWEVFTYVVIFETLILRIYHLLFLKMCNVVCNWTSVVQSNVLKIFFRTTINDSFINDKIFEYTTPNEQQRTSVILYLNGLTKIAWPIKQNQNSKE